MIASYYVLYNSLVGVYEYEVTDKYVLVDLGSYQIVYFVDTDRLILRLRPLGVFLNVYDTPSYLDVEAHPSTYLLDALEGLLKDSIVLYEESDKSYDVCIEGISYQEARRRGREIFNKLIEKLARKHGIRLEECEDVEADIGLYACYKKDNKELGTPVEVTYFYSPIRRAVCIHVEEVG